MLLSNLNFNVHVVFVFSLFDLRLILDADGNFGLEKSYFKELSWWRSLKCAREIKFSNLWIESNCQILVRAINFGGYGFSPRYVILDDIRECLSHLSICDVIHSPRAQNKVAHNLAAFAFESNPPS